MRLFVYALIIILSYILISHLLTIREEFQCLSGGAITQFNTNRNLISKYQAQVKAFQEHVEAAEKAVQLNTQQIGANEYVNYASKKAVCPSKCPGTHALGTAPNSVQTNICKCHCCDFVDATLGNYCDNPFGTSAPSPSDAEERKHETSGVPDPQYKGSIASGTGGTQQAPPGEKASANI